MFFRKSPRLIAMLLGFSMSALMISGCQSAPMNTADQPAESGAPLPEIAPAQIKQLLPDTVGKGTPVVVDFNSKFCLACQKIKPKLDKLTANTPAIKLISLDIQHPRAEDEPMLKAFHVVTVPYVAFISKSGVLKQVFLEDASEAELKQAADAAIKD